MKKLLWCTGSFFSLAIRELLLRDFKQKFCNTLKCRSIFIRSSASLLACYLVYLTTPIRLPAKLDLIESLKSPSIAGTVKKALEQSLYISKPQCLENKTALDLLNLDDIELHHIFPKKWISNNIPKSSPNYQLIQGYLKSRAILVPLRKSSNIKWLAKAPEAVLEDWYQISKGTSQEAHLKTVLRTLSVPEASFGVLTSTTGGPEQRVIDFVTQRSEYLADLIIEMCSTSDIGTTFPNF